MMKLMMMDKIMCTLNESKQVGRFRIEPMNPFCYMFDILLMFKTVMNIVALMMKLMMMDKIMFFYYIMSPNKWVDSALS